MKHDETLSYSPLAQRRLLSTSIRNTPTPKSDQVDLGLPKDRNLLTVQETARLLQVSVTTVRNMIDCGALTAGHMGIHANPKRLCLRVTKESVECLRLERFGS